MALLFIRNILFPRSGYTAVPPSSPKHLEERSIDGGFIHEKLSPSTQQSSQFRINPRIISDATIGLSDGLTVPFALTAGLSALGDTNIVIYGGLAELIAGGISMGLGGYLGAKSEAEAYNAALSEVRTIVSSDHDRAAKMVRSAFEQYDFSEQTLNSMTTGLMDEPEQMVDFLMRFHHQLIEADHAPSKAYTSGLTISLGYFFGGLVPLVPYLFFASMHEAFVVSILVMALALFAFGWAKTSLLGELDRWICLKNGMQMMTLGGVAAGAAMGCVKAVGS
ncbi:Protein ccc1 [Saxophila tyrrhenica]|uniref:Protein ccc1 n=1 Tax=Saxophila tyrrhenica TaxID=1690608 RepID=A0AAV9PEN6_9PEZI|nr:Protein ccc1 [Saxophila tyrrhenica]